MTPATPTPEQVLERLAYLQELREKRAVFGGLGLSRAINDIDQEVCEWPAEMLQRAVATLRQQATALAEAQGREALAGLASSMAADIAYFELQEQRCLAEGDTEAGARYQARLRVLRPYLIRIEGLIEFVALKGATDD